VSCFLWTTVYILSFIGPVLFILTQIPQALPKQGIAERTDMFQPTTVRRGHTDGAATWRMLLKRHLGDGFVAVSVTYGGRAATLTSEFNFQHGVSYD